MPKMQRQICAVCGKELPTVTAPNGAPDILYVNHCLPRVDAPPRGTDPKLKASKMVP